MKNVKDTLLQRRSVRRYKRQSISDADMQLIYDAIANTPTSYNGQQFTVIDVTDQAKKEQLYEITGQKQIKTCNHFLLFCVDYNRICIGAEAKGLEWPEFNNTADGLIVGVVDAALAMMSAIVAAESVNLATCPIGYARTANPDAVSELLKLPDKTFAVCGLAIGIPSETPDLKPKLDKSVLIHSDEYKQDGMEEGVLAYDRLIAEYTLTRSGNVKTHDWIGNILSYYREAMEYEELSALRRKGFDIKR